MEAEEHWVGAIENYRLATKTAMGNYRVQVCPFTKLSAKEMFSLASRYAPLFEFEEEGKGFQERFICPEFEPHVRKTTEIESWILDVVWTASPKGISEIASLVSTRTSHM